MMTEALPLPSQLFARTVSRAEAILYSGSAFGRTTPAAQAPRPTPTLICTFRLSLGLEQAAATLCSRLSLAAITACA